MEPARPSEEFVQLMEQLRSAVAERPDDPRGQRLLARNEAALGNFAAAARAQAELLRLSGPSASGQDYADYADMLILAAGGQISAEAGTALQQALRLDRRNGTASYYSGLMMARTGRPDIAFRLWDRLLNSSPADAPWVPLIRAQMPRVASLAGEDDYRLPPQPCPWRRWPVPRRKTSTTPPNCPTKAGRRWCAAWSGASASGWPTRAARPRNGHG